MRMVKVCENCLGLYQIYTTRGANQKLCPRCQAERHEETRSIPLERVRLFQGLCLVDSLPPANWAPRLPKKHGADPYMRLEIQGRALGYPWYGQITLFSPEEIYKGDVVWVRCMKTIQRGKATGELRLREYLALRLWGEELIRPPDLALTWLVNMEAPTALWLKTIGGGKNIGALAIVPMVDTAAVEEVAVEFTETFDTYAYGGCNDKPLLSQAILARLRTDEEE